MRSRWSQCPRKRGQRRAPVLSPFLRWEWLMCYYNKDSYPWYGMSRTRNWTLRLKCAMKSWTGCVSSGGITLRSCVKGGWSGGNVLFTVLGVACLRSVKAIFSCRRSVITHVTRRWIIGRSSRKLSYWWDVVNILVANETEDRSIICRHGVLQKWEL